MTTQNNLLIRIDERQKDMSKDIASIKKTLSCLDDSYVSKIEFKMTNDGQNKRIGQIEKLVFGAISLALITLGKAILDLVTIVKAGR